MDTDEIIALAFLDAGQQAAADEIVQVRTPLYVCPRCRGEGLVGNFPTLDCPDSEVLCPVCGGIGYVDEGGEIPVEMPLPEDEECS